MATVTYNVLLTADQFLEIDFGPDKRAELDNGVIRMMTDGTRGHMRVAAISCVSSAMRCVDRAVGPTPSLVSELMTHPSDIRMS